MLKNKSDILSQRILSYLKSKLPLTSPVTKMTLNIDNLKITIPNYDVEDQLTMKYTGNGNTEGYLSGTIKITDMTGNNIYTGNHSKLIVFPVCTERGTYIVNGVEKNIISQMKMKAGCYTSATEAGTVKTQLRFDRETGKGFMPAMFLELNPISKEFYVKIRSYNKEEKFNITNFLSLLGFTDTEIRSCIGNTNSAEEILALNMKRKNQYPMDRLYKIFFPRTEDSSISNPAKVERMFEFFSNNGSFGDGEAIASTLNVNTKSLNKEVIVKAVKKTVSVADGLMPEDIKDEIKYKDVYNDTDLIFESISKGIDDFLLNQTIKLDSYEPGTPGARMLVGMNDMIHKPLKKGLMSSELCVASEEINPLFMEAKQREITQGGPGGMTKDAGRNETDARNLTFSGINKIDPVETPESDKIGLTQHLTSGAIIDSRTIKTEFYKVKDRKAKIDDKNKVILSSKEEENSIVAFNDSRYLSVVDGEYVFTQDLVPGRYMGKKDMFPAYKIQYIDSKAQNIMGTSANSIPFVQHDDGARALMGAGMQKQAVNTINREAPSVTTLADIKTGQTFDEKVGEEYGRPVRSRIDGTVAEINDKKIVVMNGGKREEHSYYRYFPLNQSYINNEVIVKIGDKVKAGQILAEGWQTRDGKLALGLNTNIAYMSWKGRNYEDGLAISESFAKKMTSEEYEEVEVFIPKEAKGGRGSRVKEELKRYTANASLGYFDEDGIIRVGSEIKAGSVLVGFLKEIQQDSDDILDIIARGAGKINYKYSEETIPSGSYVAGKIERISVVNNPDASNSQKIIFGIVNRKPLKIGDKVAGRHGNKGTIDKIIPDNLMPVREDGVRIDLLMSPLAIPSRKNVGQVLEANAGLIAQKTGERFVVSNFDHTEKERVKSGLKAIGYEDGKMGITLKEEDEEGNGSIINVPTENKVTVGTAYFMKLKHKTDDKIQSRSNRETPLTQKTHMPQKVVGTAQGEKSNPQRLGEMEMRALQAHGAIWNVLESSTIKADGGGDAKTKAAIFKAISTGKLEASELNSSAVPETVKVLSDTIKVLGLNVKPMYNGVEVGIDKPFNSLGIAPLNQKDFVDTIGHDKEVFKSDILQARQLYGDKNTKTDKNKTAPDIKGGLLDTDIFGTGSDKEDRNKWGYIKLPMPVANPMFMEDVSNNIYSTLTGIKPDNLKKLAGSTTKPSEQKAVILLPEEYDLSKIKDKALVKSYQAQFAENIAANGFKPGDLVSVSTLDKLKSEGVNIPYKTGGAALQYLLEKVNIDTLLSETTSALNKEKKPEKINELYKKTKQLEMLKNNNLKPEDLMVNIVPVAPSYLRPIIPKKEDRNVLVNDLNKLYGALITSKQTAEKEAVLDANGRISDASGLAPIDLAQRSKSLYDSLMELQGSSHPKTEWKSVKDTIGGKYGIVRKEMLAKREDFSGRSVITVDPDLKLDEAGIPMDMAKTMYKPFLIKALVDNGTCKNEAEAENRIAKPDEEVKKTLQQVANDRPIFLNRQPSLHKYSIQPLRSIIKEYEDGGVVRSIKLNPLIVTGFNADFDGDTMAAHVPVTEKAKEEAKAMLPSNNLINPTDGSMVIEIRHEMVLGIYQITKHWDKPIGKTKIYTDNKTLIRDYLTGKIPYNQKVKVPISMMEVTAGQAMFNWLIPDKVSKYRNFKVIWNKNKISTMLRSIYDESEATDFKLISKQEIANLFDAIKDLGFKTSTRSGVSLGINDFEFSKETQNIINGIMTKHGDSIESFRKAESEIESKLKGGLLPEDNPLQIMMNSGARANAQQIRKMSMNIGVGMDVSKNLLNPIKYSHFDGLSPEDYYELGKDSRKGIYDRSVSTEEPGTVTRSIWAATQDIVITEKDCGTKEFISLKKNDQTIKGRYAGKDILATNGSIICKKNQLITNDMYQKIWNDDSIAFVPVRSVLRCKTIGGKCQKCYGAMAGTMQPVKLGSAVGVIASQAAGEPITQMTMNTFHTGGANSSATLGLPAIKSLLNMKAPGRLATIAENSGTVNEIIESPREIIVCVGQRKYKIQKLNGDTAATLLRVKKGDLVQRGDFLTVGDLSDITQSGFAPTSANPQKLFKNKSEELGQQGALNYTRDYLSSSMQNAISGAGSYMDRRHSETIISKLTSEAMVIDSGDSPYMKGQKADVNLFEKWNSDNAKKIIELSPTDMKLTNSILAEDILNGSNLVFKKGTLITQKEVLILSKYPKKIKVFAKPIQYQVSLQGQSTASKSGNWFSDLGTEDVKSVLVSGAKVGAIDNLVDPRSRLMAGKILNIGDGINMDKTTKDTYSNNMLNFFMKK